MRNKLLIGFGALTLMTAATATTGATAAPANIGSLLGLDIKLEKLVKTVALRPPGIRRSLRQRGYYNIVFTDRHLPVYKVRACKNGKRFNIRLNRWGGIMLRTRIGWCRDAGPNHGLSLPQIRRKMRNRGYRQIHFTDRKLPIYQAVACKNNKRFYVLLNRFGKVMDRNRIGRCGR